MRKYGVWFMSAMKILLGIVMIFGGISTAFSPTAPLDGAMGMIFASRPSLILFGVSFAASGFMLIYAKFRRDRKMVGRSLMVIYLLTFFTFLLEIIVFQAYSNWIDNLVITIIAALLYLYWKHKTEWLTPKEIAQLRREAKHLNGDLPRPPSV